MFSQLGPLFKTMLRQAEKTDTRLEIRRDEKRDQGTKQDFETAGEDDNSLWEDSASVSVPALRNFLLEFLKSRGEEDAMARPQAANPFEAPYIPETLPPANSIAARAMKAYGAHTPAAPTAPAPETTQGAPPTESLSDLLAADEIRTMHALIAALDDLEKRGVHMLAIEKAETFLQSLVNAVEAEKARF